MGKAFTFLKGFGIYVLTGVGVLIALGLIVGLIQRGRLF